MIFKARVSGCAVFVALAFPVGAQADIIKYVDENGTLHFTDHAPAQSYTVYIKEKTVKRAGPAKRRRNFSREIRTAGEKHGVDYNLIRSVIKAESDFDPDAVSRAGAKGLMQLMPGTARRYGVKDVHDPSENINGGTGYLKYLIKKYNGDVRMALAAYNAGESAVEEYSGIPPYRETRKYVSKVMTFYEKLSGRRTGSGGHNIVYRYLDENGTLVLTDTPRIELKSH